MPTQFNYIHRFAGRLVVLAANVHTLGYRTPMITDHVTILIPGWQSTSGP
jgi:hypothetical protein